MAGENGNLWDHPTPSMKGGTLLDNMGGEKAVHDFVYGLYDRILQDAETAPYLLRSQQTQSLEVYLKLLKDRTVEYLVTVWGGDTWESQDLFKSHAQLHISAQAYDRCVKMAAIQVKAQGLPSLARKEVMAQMQLMKDPITDADGRFHSFVAKRQSEMEAKLGEEGDLVYVGMGFTATKATVALWAEQKRLKEERSEKLAAAKAKRKQLAKEASRKETADEKARKASQIEVVQTSAEISTAASSFDQTSANKIVLKSKEEDSSKKRIVPSKQSTAVTSSTPTRHKKAPLQENTKNLLQPKKRISLKKENEAPHTETRQEMEAPREEPWKNWPDLPEEVNFGFVPESQLTPLITFCRAVTL